MSITPVGNATFINQNAPVVSQTHANNQARFDLQSALASQIASEEMQDVTALRPAEETYKIDPQNQHEKQKGEEEASEQERENLARKGDDEDEQSDEISQDADENSAPPSRRLDIEV